MKFDPAEEESIRSAIKRRNRQLEAELSECNDGDRRVRILKQLSDNDRAAIVFIKAKRSHGEMDELHELVRQQDAALAELRREQIAARRNMFGAGAVESAKRALEAMLSGDTTKAQDMLRAIADQEAPEGKN
jgi:hypothetical protein